MSEPSAAPAAAAPATAAGPRSPHERRAAGLLNSKGKPYSTNWGGARPHGGKKKRLDTSPRSRVAIKRLLVDLSAAKSCEGMQPLDIMLAASRAAYATALKSEKEVDSDLLRMAVQWARDAAPYCHMRLLSAEVGGKPGQPLQIFGGGQVLFYVPDNGRRVVPPPPANDPSAGSKEAVA